MGGNRFALTHWGAWKRPSKPKPGATARASRALGPRSGRRRRQRHLQPHAAALALVVGSPPVGEDAGQVKAPASLTRRRATRLKLIGDRALANLDADASISHLDPDPDLVLIPRLCADRITDQL